MNEDRNRAAPPVSGPPVSGPPDAGPPGSGTSGSAQGGGSRASWRRYVPALVVAAAVVSLILGLLLPSLEFYRFFLLSERHSLFGVVVALLQEREYFLGLVLGAFSIVFPSLKLAVLARLAAGRIAGKGMPASTARLAALFGRWSMLDVLVIALVVFAVKRSGLAEATALPGIWFFALAAILSIVAARLLETRGRAAL